MTRRGYLDEFGEYDEPKSYVAAVGLVQSTRRSAKQRSRHSSAPCRFATVARSMRLGKSAGAASTEGGGATPARATRGAVGITLTRDSCVAFGNRRSQAAEMVLAPGDAEGGADNRHRGSDQWLYVAAGEGTAIIGGRRYRLQPGTLLLVERRERHEIRNTGRAPLRTLNIYVPPAYTKRGDPLPRGRK